jgi:hypothetical protein
VIAFTDDDRPRCHWCRKLLLPHRAADGELCEACFRRHKCKLCSSPIYRDEPQSTICPDCAAVVAQVGWVHRHGNGVPLPPADAAAREARVEAYRGRADLMAPIFDAA